MLAEVHICTVCVIPHMDKLPILHFAIFIHLLVLLLLKVVP